MASPRFSIHAASHNCNPLQPPITVPPSTNTGGWPSNAEGRNRFSMGCIKSSTPSRPTTFLSAPIETQTQSKEKEPKTKATDNKFLGRQKAKEIPRVETHAQKPKSSIRSATIGEKWRNRNQSLMGSSSK
ncbi:hypothetical protein SLA2020_418370 [Shorea laevis]